MEREWSSRSVGHHIELIERLRQAVGKGNFRLEMRNNMYKIIVTDPGADMHKVDAVGRHLCDETAQVAPPSTL
jgi:hypothetical protein